MSTADTVEVADRYELSTRQVKRIATPAAVARWLQRQAEGTRTLIPPHCDEIKNSDLLSESSEATCGESSCPLPDDPGWIADCWRASVGCELENWQLRQLRSWASDAATDDGADDGGCGLVDLVRIIEYAGRPEIRDPWRYVQVAVERRLGKEPEYRQELEQVAGEAGCRYAEYGLVRNRRAYLATFARNADLLVTTADAIGDGRTGYIDEYVRRHGKLPWDTDDGAPADWQKPVHGAD